MEIKPLSVSRILPHTLTVWLHHEVLPQTDRRHFKKKGSRIFMEDTVDLHLYCGSEILVQLNRWA
jgi:hypothetical protein